MGLNMDDGKVIESLTDMAESLAGINATLKAMEKRIDSIDNRVMALEKQPTKIVGYILSALISAVIVYIFK